MRRLISLFAAALLTTGLLTGPAAAAPPPTCVAPVPSPTQPGYTIADPNCDVGTNNPFVPLVDAAGQPLSRVFTGIRDGAAFRIEVPLRWNGELVIWAHGFRGTGRTVWVDSSPLRAFHVQQGFAWAASSYQTNGYDVGQGVRDSVALVDIFASTVGRRASSVYMTGASMGGHITAVAIEHFPRTFVGAMPLCGVLADARLFDYFLDANVTAAALTGVPITFPLQPPPDYPQTWTQQVRAELPLLGTGIGTGNVTSNLLTIYQLDDKLRLSPAEAQLNLNVLRVGRTALPSRDLTGIPKVEGDPHIPVLSLHDIGDLFVPISMEQIYARRALLHGQHRHFVSRAIRGVEHCDFNAGELTHAFADLVGWVRSGHRPDGDDILNPHKVA